MALQKRVRIFAGPNGSGKTTLKEIIASQFHVGVYVNADDILANMRSTLRLEFLEYGLIVNEKEFEEEYSKWTIPTNRALWFFDNNGIAVKNKDEIEDYFVSFLADFIRKSLLTKGIDRFSFETVMSHPSKLEFMRKAKNMGYRVYLYFISLPDPDLNVLRVQTRVKAGGHNVDPEKVVSRYNRTMDLLFEALKIADKAYIFDNSTQKPQLIATKDNGELKTEGTYIPQWYKTYVLDRLT